MIMSALHVVSGDIPEKMSPVGSVAPFFFCQKSMRVKERKMTIEIDNWPKIPPSASPPGGESLDVAYHMQSIRRIRNLKSTIVNLEVYLEYLQGINLQVGEGLAHEALEAEVTEELEKAYDLLAEQRSHEINMTPAWRDGYMYKDDPDSVICAF